ncbi:hypothetical protein D3C81_361530 [compost metagenome]
MKDINSAPGSTSFTEFWNALCAHARQGLDALSAMSWPRLLACAIGLAFVITILPLAITLFLVFLLLKWAGNAGGFSWDKKTAQQEQPPQA